MTWRWRRGTDPHFGDVWYAEGPEAPRALISLGSPEGAALALAQLVGQPWRVVSGRPSGPVADHRPDAVYLDVSGMDRVLGVDPRSGAIHVEAGITWAAAERAARGCELTLGPVPAWLGQRTVIESFALDDRLRPSPRYGQLTDAVLALRAALPGGGVTRSAVAPRRATGPDLARTVVGASHRAGLMTDVHLRGWPLPHRRQYRAVGFDEWSVAVSGAVAALRDGVLPEWWCLRRVTGRVVLVASLVGDQTLDADLERFDAAVRGAALDPEVAVALARERFPEPGTAAPMTLHAVSTTDDLAADAARARGVEVWDIRPEGGTLYGRKPGAGAAPDDWAGLAEQLYAALEERAR